MTSREGPIPKLRRRTRAIVLGAAALIGACGGATGLEDRPDGGDAAALDGDAGTLPGDGPDALEACRVACALDERQALRSLDEACPADQREPGLMVSAGRGECETDADCDLSLDGRCHWAGPPESTCTYHHCSTTSDCADGQICVCAAGPLGQNRCLTPTCDGCRANTCRLSIDCAGPDSLLYGADALLCMTPVDGCREADDCPRDEFCTRGGWTGGYDRSFQCSSQTCGF